MIRKFVSIFISISLILSIFPQLGSAQGENLVINGDFEHSGNNGLFGWTSEGTLTVQSEVVYDGSFSALVSNRKSVQNLFHQAISVKSGQDYRVSAMVRLKDSAYNGTVLNIYTPKINKDKSGGSIEATADEWKCIEMYATASDISSYISIACYAGKDIDFYIDNITVEEISPAELVIKGANLMKAPENGVSKIRLRSEILDTNGNSDRYKDYEDTAWSLESDVRGVSIDENGVVTADYRAEDSTITVIAEKTNGERTFTDTYDIEILSCDTDKDKGNLYFNGNLENAGTEGWTDGTKILSDNYFEGYFAAYKDAGGACGQTLWLEPEKNYYLTAMINSMGSEDKFWFICNNKDVIINTEIEQPLDSKWHRMTAVVDTSGLIEDTLVAVSVYSNGTAPYYADCFYMAQMQDDFKNVEAEVEFYNGKKPVKGLVKGNNTAKVSLRNHLEEKKITVLLALYENTDKGMTLKNAAISDTVILKPGDIGEIQETISVSNEKTQVLKVYIWDEKSAPWAVHEVQTQKESIEYHVAKNGSSSNSGSAVRPFSTLSDALGRIFAINKEGNYPEGGITVIMHEGDYSSNSSQFLTSQNFGGTVEAPVIIKAAENETVVFTGSTELDKGAFSKVTDEDFLSKLTDQSVRDKIVVMDLEAEGISTDYDMNYPGSYPGPDTDTAIPHIPELIVDGEPMTLARYPNSGYMRVDEVLEGGTENPFVIKPDDSRFLNWTEADDALIYGMWGYTWHDLAVPLAEIDTENMTITAGHRTADDVNVKNAEYYVYNLPEEIDSPGEYYIDRENSLLYFYPPENMESVRFSQLDRPLLWGRDCSNVIVEGITFTDTRGYGIFLEERCNNIQIKNCTVKNTSKEGVFISGSCRDSGLTDCYIKNTNGGIGLHGGNLKTIEEGRCFVENCEVENYSRIQETYKAGIIIGGCGNVVKHNEIHEGPQLGIQFWGSNHLIEYNEIYNVLKHADDMSAIYTGKSWVNRGNVIQYNYIHDLNTSVTDGSGVHGIYLDDCFSGVTINGNIIANINRGSGFLINGGRDNYITGNIIANVSPTTHSDGVFYGTIFFTSIGTSQDMSHLYKSLEASNYRTEQWKYAYPSLYCINENEAIKPVDNILENTLLVNSGNYITLWGEINDLLHIENFCKEPESPDFEHENGYIINKDSWVFDKIPGMRQLPVKRMGRTEEILP